MMCGGVVEEEERFIILLACGGLQPSQ